MPLDLSFEEVLTEDEVLSGLAITQEDLTDLEAGGLQFIEIGDAHFYLSSTLLTFLKEIQRTAKKRGGV